MHVCWPGGGLCISVGLEEGCTCLLARIVMGMAGSDRKEGCTCLLAWRRVVHVCWPGGGLYMSVG